MYMEDGQNFEGSSVLQAQHLINQQKHEVGDQDEPLMLGPGEDDFAQ